METQCLRFVTNGQFETPNRRNSLICPFFNAIGY